MEKNHKTFLRKPKQIRVKLHRNKRKTLLASWKRSELVDETKNWDSSKNYEYYIILLTTRNIISDFHFCLHSFFSNYNRHDKTWMLPSVKVLF